MIDLHSHIIPGVDDGASDLNTSLQILGEMEQKGVKKVAATPHYPLYGNENYQREYKIKLNKLQTRARENNLKIEIVSGSEIMMVPELSRLYYNDQLISLHKTDYLLLELGLSTFPDYFADIIHDLKSMGAEIIIAHPERYHYIQSDYTMLYEWLQKHQIKIMLNSSSLTGAHGKRAAKTALKLIEMGLVHLMASDTHGIKKRPFSLDQGLKAAEKIRAGSSTILKENAEAVLKNQPLNNLELKKEEKAMFSKVFSFINVAGGFLN